MENNRVATARILVIDDEEGMREGCRRALVSAGHAVDAAPDLATGREFIKFGTRNMTWLILS